MNKTKKESTEKARQEKVHRRFLVSAIVFVVISICLAVFAYFQRSDVVVVSKAGVSLSINKVEYDTAGKAPFEAPPGMKFVIAHITLNNTKKEAFNFAAVTQTYLTDSLKNRYEMAPATLTDPIMAGSVPAGEKRTGSISFLVPVEAEGLSISFNP